MKRKFQTMPNYSAEDLIIWNTLEGSRTTIDQTNLWLLRAKLKYNINKYYYTKLILIWSNNDEKNYYLIMGGRRQ